MLAWLDHAMSKRPSSPQPQPPAKILKAAAKTPAIAASAKAPKAPTAAAKAASAKASEAAKAPAAPAKVDPAEELEEELEPVPAEPALSATLHSLLEDAEQTGDWSRAKIINEIFLPVATFLDQDAKDKAWKQSCSVHLRHFGGGARTRTRSHTHPHGSHTHT